MLDHSCECGCVCLVIMFHLKDMCFEDVMAQLDGLLSVQLVLQAREPEGQQGVSAPAEIMNTSRQCFLPLLVKLSSPISTTNSLLQNKQYCKIKF